MMRARYSWIFAIAILGLLFAAGCSDDDSDKLPFDGSNTWLEHMYIGNVEVQTGRTVNVPLAQTASIRFEVASEVTPQSLSQLFDFQIRIENVDTGYTFLITDANLDENGELYWVDASNKIIEYRMNHSMSYFISGGQKYTLGAVGNMFKVKVDFVIGKLKDGNQFSFTGDEFRVVWTESSQGYSEE